MPSRFDSEEEAEKRDKTWKRERENIYGTTADKKAEVPRIPPSSANCRHSPRCLSCTDMVFGSPSSRRRRQIFCRNFFFS